MLSVDVLLVDLLLLMPVSTLLPLMPTGTLGESKHGRVIIFTKVQ